MRPLFHSALLSLCALTVHASAQARVCIGGDLGRLSTAQKNRCLASAALVRAEATRFNAPADWHFFIVCTEYDWQTYAAYSDRSAAQLAAMNADTSLGRRATFFRGEALAASDPARLHLAVAHEVASALLGSQDELAIQDRVSQLIPSNDRADMRMPPLRASR